METLLVDFNVRYSPLLPAKRAKGLLVGDYLVVSFADANLNKPTYCIYNVFGHKLFKNILFKTTDEAVAFAKLLDEHFSEYFQLWEEYPQSDVFAWAKGSVEGGEDIYKLIQEKNK